MATPCSWGWSRPAWPGSWGIQGRRPYRGDLGQGIARLDRAGVRRGGRGGRPASRDRRRATRAARAGADAVGERPGCVPHDPGGTPGVAPELAPVERCWEQAEAATRRVRRSGGRARIRGVWRAGPVGPGTRPRRPSGSTRRSEAGWEFAHGALAVLRPAGRLNDSAWARERIALALPGAVGPRVVQGAGLAPGRGDVDVPGSGVR